MEQHICVRSAILDDADDICEFVNQLEGAVFDRGKFDRYFRENLGAERNHYLVALVDGKPVGFISCHGQILLHHSGLVCEIQELFVDSRYRSKGVGAELIKALETRLAKEDYELLEVACSFKRTDTHRFYLANGFGQTHYEFTKPRQ